MKTMITRSKVFAARPILILIFLLASFGSFAQAGASMCRLAVQLWLNNGSGPQNMADGVMVLFNQSFSSAVGPEDSYKFVNMDENVAVVRNGVMLSVEGRPDLTGYDTIPLKIWKYRQTSYCLKFIPNMLCDSVVGYLKDNYTHQDIPIDLMAPSVIPYTITSDSASFAPDRLCIVFRPASSMSLGLSSINAALKQNQVQVDWSVPSTNLYDKYTVQWSASGSQFTDVAVVDGAEQHVTNFRWYDVNPRQGINYYRIVAITKTGRRVYSPVVKVMNGKVSQGITVFPNPVQGNKVGVQLSNLPEGEYYIAIMNNAGLPVYKTSFRHPGGNSSRTLPLNNTLPRGNYVLQVNGSGQVYSSNILCN